MTAPVARLLDTNIVSEMMRPSPESRVAAFLDEIDDQGIGLSSVTVWEILTGIDRLDPGHSRDDCAERFQAILDDLRIHDLRHSFASSGLPVGEGLPMIGKLLGHPELQTTARCAHLANDPVKAANRIARRISEVAGVTIPFSICELPSDRLHIHI